MSWSCHSFSRYYDHIRGDQARVAAVAVCGQAGGLLPPGPLRPGLQAVRRAGNQRQADHCHIINHVTIHCNVIIDNAGKICSGNGKCKGGGTRKGNGRCQCSSEYTGELCDQCSDGHYQSFKVTVNFSGLYSIIHIINFPGRFQASVLSLSQILFWSLHRCDCKVV